LARLAEDWQKALSDMNLEDGQPQIESDVASVSLAHHSKHERDRRPDNTSQQEECGAGAMANTAFPSSDVESRAATRAMPYAAPGQDELPYAAPEQDKLPRQDKLPHAAPKQDKLPYVAPKQDKARFVSLKDAWSRFNLEDKEEIVFENQVSRSRADFRGSPAGRAFG
jgi:hypothetical protein